MIMKEKQAIGRILRNSHYTTQERITLLMSGWTAESKARLRAKMEKLGIQQGGILNTLGENLELYKYLTRQV